jgi:hypothetical protein
MQKPFATQPELFVTPRPLSPAPAKCYNQEASIKAFADGIATGDIIHQAK